MAEATVKKYGKRSELQDEIDQLTAKTTSVSEPGTRIEERVKRLRQELTKLLNAYDPIPKQLDDIKYYINDLTNLHKPKYNGNTNYKESDDIAKAAALKAKNLTNEILKFKMMTREQIAGGSMKRKTRRSKTKKGRKMKRTRTLE
jgi:predicted nuclease with TOPRIM domain